MRARNIAVAATAAIALIAPTSALASHAPNVRCKQLDRAERSLLRKGFNVSIRGGGILGVVVKSAWVVVNQRQSGNRVILTAGRSC